MKTKLNKKDDDLAWTILDNDVSVFADSAGLLRISLGSSGIGLWLEVVFLVRHDDSLIQLYSTHWFNSVYLETDCDVRESRVEVINLYIFIVFFLV